MKRKMVLIKAIYRINNVFCPVICMVNLCFTIPAQDWSYRVYKLQYSQPSIIMAHKSEEALRWDLTLTDFRAVLVNICYTDFIRGKYRLGVGR